MLSAGVLYAESPRPNMISINEIKISELVGILKQIPIPTVAESSTHSFSWISDNNILANSYFAIVAICHQTSPIGENRLKGYIDNELKEGWDYLKERFLMCVQKKTELSDVLYWKNIKPLELSEIFTDQLHGKTLNRVNERTYFLNNLGEVLSKDGFANIHEAFLHLTVP